MALKQDIGLVVDLLQDGKAHESQLREATGWGAEYLARVLESAHKRMLAVPVSRRRDLADPRWITVEDAIALCPWGRADVLKAVRKKECSTRELAKLSGGTEDAMRLLLLDMQARKQIKQMAFSGIRKWVPASRQGHLAGPQPAVKPERLLELIAERQPVKLELLAELVGRGRFHVRAEVHKLRRQGLVKIIGKDRSWTYAMPDYKPGAEEVGREILLRCEEKEGDCLVWSGGRSPQGHPVMRHDGNVRRVDLILWTFVHGKALKPGYTLVRTCETPGCCNHAHHKQVTRSAAMRIAFAAKGEVWAKEHGRKVSASVRDKIGVLTPAQVELVRSSTLSQSKMAKELGCRKSVVGSARRHETYRDYAPNPFAGLMMKARAAA